MITSLQELSRIVSGSMLNGIALGLAVAAIAYALLRVIRRANSSTRFVIWYLVLLLMVLLPVFDFIFARSTGSSSRAEITIPATWALYFFVFWAIVAFAGLARVAAAILQVRKLRRAASPLDDPELSALLQKTAREFSMRRPVEIRTSEQVRVPTAIGFFRPMVLIPLWAAKELSQPELTAVVLHEFAHLRRCDDWTNLVQRILGAILFFHPAVWWIHGRLALEREMACDDLVIAATSNPRAYAQCLVAIAERSFLQRGLAMAQAAVGRLRQTSLRVSQILKPRRSISTGVWKPSLIVVTASVLATFLGVQHLPRFVAFSSQASQSSAAPAGISYMDYRPGKDVVIPASRHQQDILAPKSSAVATRWRAEHHQAPAVPITAKAPASKPKAMVVRAELKPEQDIQPPDVFLVVMRTEQNSASGTTFWSIRVYRLTVFHPNEQQIRNETPAKKT